MEEKKKVLFVVYRTEWWGCLEGYCRQECAKEDVTCYVLPVPRYEREDITYKANFEKVHFHPEKLTSVLPEGACLADWQSFSLEQDFERIYIHNPYENGSLTDTVELKYYASSLKQHTKKLIYVSHLMDLIPEDYANCKAYEYVDAIYVPRESTRFYLDVKYDSKVETVPSGLPGYLDRLAEKINDRKAPEKHEDSQQNTLPCGDNQKAVAPMKLLYCVSYSDLYHGTEKQLQKMSEIFEYVKRNPDIRLIFRPDEDIRARRQTLDEKIWKGYRQLVTDFKRNRIGIYDKSPDLYEAAVTADGIMSRNHPMNLLFSVQGKYVLQVDWVRRPEPPSCEEQCTPAIWDAAVTEKEGEIELLFVPSGTRLICRMVISGEELTAADGFPVPAAASAGRKDAGFGTAKSKTIAEAAKKEGKEHLFGPKVEIVAEVPDEIIRGLNYMYLCRQEDCLYLIPCDSDGIWKCDIKTGYFGKAYLPDFVPGPVSAVFSYNRYLYMAPSAYPGIVKYDTETEEITIIDGWVRDLDAGVSEECAKEPYFSWAAVQEGHMLYLASSKRDIWMEFDMATDTWRLLPMNLPGQRFVHMVKDGEWVWLLPYVGDEIILWNCVSGEGRTVYKSENQNREPGFSMYLFALDLGDSIAAFPQRRTDHILIIPKSIGRDALTKQAGNAAGQADDMTGFINSTANQTENMTNLSGRTGKYSVRKISQGIPCSPRDCSSEYRKNLGCGYEMVKRLDNGLILAYEYYEGTFMLLDGKLNLIRRIPCRLNIETIRRQQDVIWKNAQVRSDYSGRLSDSSSIPVMLENFLRHGRENREEIREHYRKCYRIMPS